jgi:hypothetical protein
MSATLRLRNSCCKENEIPHDCRHVGFVMMTDCCVYFFLSSSEIFENSFASNAYARKP